MASLLVCSCCCMTAGCYDIIGRFNLDVAKIGAVTVDLAYVAVDVDIANAVCC